MNNSHRSNHYLDTETITEPITITWDRGSESDRIVLVHYLIDSIHRTHFITRLDFVLPVRDIAVADEFQAILKRSVPFWTGRVLVDPDAKTPRWRTQTGEICLEYLGGGY